MASVIENIASTLTKTIDARCIPNKKDKTVDITWDNITWKVDLKSSNKPKIWDDENHIIRVIRVSKNDDKINKIAEALVDEYGKYQLNLNYKDINNAICMFAIDDLQGFEEISRKITPEYGLIIIKSQNNMYRVESDGDGYIKVSYAYNCNDTFFYADKFDASDPKSNQYVKDKIRELEQLS